jgi:hypothetical protein
LPAAEKFGTPTAAVLMGLRSEMSGVSMPPMNSHFVHRSMARAVRSRGGGNNGGEPDVASAKKSSSMSALNVPPNTLSMPTAAPSVVWRSDIPNALPPADPYSGSAAAPARASSGTSALFDSAVV